MDSDSDEECFDRMEGDGDADGDYDGHDDDDGVNGDDGLGIDLTGILFGNIDSEGKLVDEGESSAFDADLREHLGSLSR